jgi:type I restriction enzyme, R subunit
LSLGDTRPEKPYAAWQIRLLPNRQVPADIEITEDVMRLHAFKTERKEASSASLAAGDTMPLSPIKEFAAPQRLPLAVLVRTRLLPVMPHS